MDNFRNKYSDSIPVTIRMSPRHLDFSKRKANASGTKHQVWLEELLEAAIMAKMDPIVAPSYFQKLAVEAAVTACGVE